MWWLFFLVATTPRRGGTHRAKLREKCKGEALKGIQQNSQNNDAVTPACYLKAPTGAALLNLRLVGVNE